MAKSAIYSVPPDFYERVFGGGEPPPPSPLTGGAGYVNSFRRMYELIVQIPGLSKPDFLQLCRNFNITLRDSEAFEADMEVLPAP